MEGPGRDCDPGLSREGKVSLPRGYWELRHLLVLSWGFSGFREEGRVERPP